MSKDSRPVHEQEWRDSLPYNNVDPKFKGLYKASCHCGNVTYEASEDPVSSVVCHCTTCQVVHGAPMQWATIFHKDHLKFSKESLDSLEFYNTHEKKSGRECPCKVSCRNCGTLIADEGRNMWLAFPTLFNFTPSNSGSHSPTPPKSFQPTNHMFYDQRVIDVVRKEGVTFWRGKKGDSEKWEEDLGSNGEGVKTRSQDQTQGDGADAQEQDENGSEKSSSKQKKRKTSGSDL